MATGQSLLDRMELVDQELQLQAAEADVTRGLLALNVAQDYLESRLALIPKAFGDTTGTVVTASSTETTAFPSGVLRIDRIQFIDPTTSRPSGPDLVNLRFVGAHVNTATDIPGFLLTASSTSRPYAYWTQGRNIYWYPLPDAVHTFRYYGLVAQADITAAATFNYPDYMMLPLAVFAAKLLQTGVGDNPTALMSLAQEVFDPALDAMQAVGRGDRPAGYDYTFVHDA